MDYQDYSPGDVVFRSKSPGPGEYQYSKEGEYELVRDTVYRQVRGDSQGGREFHTPNSSIELFEWSPKHLEQ